MLVARYRCTPRGLVSVFRADRFDVMRIPPARAHWDSRRGGRVANMLPRHPEDVPVDVAFRIAELFTAEPAPSTEGRDVTNYDVRCPRPNAEEVLCAAASIAELFPQRAVWQLKREAERRAATERNRAAWQSRSRAV